MPLSNLACLELLKQMGKGDVTVHCFRSSFRDRAGESTSHAREVIEHAMSHQLKDKAEAAYARGTMLERRRTRRTHRSSPRQLLHPPCRSSHKHLLS